jgi:hypothetical protein
VSFGTDTADFPFADREGTAVEVVRALGFIQQTTDNHGAPDPGDRKVADGAFLTEQNGDGAGVMGR